MPISDRKRASNKAYRLLHAERLREAKKLWRQTHKAQVKQQRIEWDLNNPEKVKAHRKRVRLKNPIRLKQRKKEYYERHKSKIALKLKGYRKAHSKERCKAAREWALANPEKRRLIVNKSSHLRRARKLGTVIDEKSIGVFMSGVKAKRSAVCYYCQRKVSTKIIHFDHIIALSKGGAHSVENLCVACAKCNMAKSARRLRDFVTLGQQILEL